MTKPESTQAPPISDDVARATSVLETVLWAMGTSLRHYMPATKEKAVETMRQALEAERRRCAACCDAFDAPASDSDFVNGQATAAQQIRASILKGAA